jgi:DNA-directed RNA polymerase subunit RPC12/RpoP
MTVRYEYKCNKCGKDYVEQRGAQEPQFFSDCGKSDCPGYEEVGKTVIAETIEVSAASEVIVEEVTPAIE